MDYLSLMKSILDNYIDRLKQGDVKCHIPERKGVRRMIPGHLFHDHPEIFLQTGGETLFSFPNEKAELTSGEMLVVPPEMPHAEEARHGEGTFENLVITPAADYLQCHVSGRSKDMMPRILHYESYECGEHITIRHLTDLIVEKHRLPGSCGQSILRGLMLALLSSVRVLLDGTVIGEDMHPKVREAKNAILSRYHDRSLKVGLLARQLNCTPDYLSWLFHRETGMTLNRYINELRLKRAADLLRNTDYSVSEIAWICGYGSPAYFSRLFSREFSSSPVNFRRSL